MPEGQLTDIAVLTTRLDQMCQDICKIQQNVEKLANGQETRLRALERYQAQAQERWANHLELNRQAWAAHAEVHGDMKFKDRLADGANFVSAAIMAAIAAIFGANR